VHAPFFDVNTHSTKWSQTNKRQINFLDELDMHFPKVGNGYVHLNGTEPIFPDEDDGRGGAWDKLLTLYKIGYHKNAQVTSGHKVNGQFLRVDDSNQVVDQVFCAALNIIQGLNGKRNGEIQGVEAKCKFLLKCAYEGSYLSAIHNNRKKLFLTLIGAGSFGNKLEWIYEAILNAHLKWGSHPNNTLKKVYIVLYTNTAFHPPFVAQLKKYNVAYTQTTYIKGEPRVDEKFEPIKGKNQRYPLKSSKSSDTLLGKQTPKNNLNISRSDGKLLDKKFGCEKNTQNNSSDDKSSEENSEEILERRKNKNC